MSASRDDRPDRERDRRESDPDSAATNYRAGGPSPNETDRAVRAAPKSEWQEPRNPAAGDPMTEEERQGMDLLGQESVRGGAIGGVSGMGDVLREGHRRNPPQLDDVNNAAGDLSQSGGVAGGFRGSAGRSDAGAGDPGDETRSGPAEHRGTSRMDLDHPSTDIGGADNDARGRDMGPER